jgi:dTDP-4-amino-4,6-dideoxygalactose transaminase
MSPEALHDRLALVAERRGRDLYNRETGRRFSAVLPVHVFGHPANVPALRKVADEWGLPLVEDAAEALGSWRHGTHCGLEGEVGILSFNGNKLITTGGGGALITNNVELADRAKHLSTTAKLPHSWEFDHDAIGWNDRLPNLNAALGFAQLEDLERRLCAKQELLFRYERSFAHTEAVRLVNQPPSCRSNNWLVSLCFTSPDPFEAEQQRHNLLEMAHAEGLMLRPVWKLLHHLPMYQPMPKGDLSTAQDLAKRLVNLPSSPQLIGR